MEDNLFYLIPLVVFPALISIERFIKEQYDKSRLEQKIKISEDITHEAYSALLERRIHEYQLLEFQSYTKEIDDSTPSSHVETTKLTPIICSQCGAPLDNHYHCLYCGTNFSSDSDIKSCDVVVPDFTESSLLETN